MSGQGKHLLPHLQNHGLLQEENLDPQDILLSKSTSQSYFRKSQALSADLLQKSILSYHLSMQLPMLYFFRLLPFNAENLKLHWP